MGELHEMEFSEMWTCPRCGSQLAGVETPHECGVYSATTLFSSSEPQIYDLFLRLQERVTQLGDATVFPQRTQVEFFAARPFMHVEPRGNYMAVTFHFKQRESHPRFAKIEEAAPGEWLHTLRLSQERELDAEFTAWLERAYREAQ